VERLWLRARAPFAAYRGLQAGVYRTTAPTIPPSAALGLILNLCGIEMRGDTSQPVTPIREDVPRMRLAIGEVTEPTVATLYQQLHTYPVGNDGKEHKSRTHGGKYWIAPARREFLVGFDVVLGIEPVDPALGEGLRRGLAGQLDEPRYGLPFAGDNNFLFDELRLLDAPPCAHWYAPVRTEGPPSRRSCRLTVGIDRSDNSRSTSILVAPSDALEREPPEDAWIWTPAPP
jgi:CRISPR-associated protein Cas5t